MPKIKHGHTTKFTQSRTYSSWSMMLQRCNNPNHIAWPDYGGRGIKVCDRWREFTNFLRDMGEKPQGKTLERKDVNGPYCPANCEWKSFEEQMHNMRKNRNFTVNGITGCISVLSRHFGIHVATATNRLNAGWSPEKAFTHPVQ